MYHYTDSGLDNVWLANGYHKHKTAYGEGISIDNTEALHRVIGKWLVSVAKPLNGAELRFIRLELEMTQHDLADRLGTKEQTLRLWEKQRDKEINGSADRLLRALYAEHLGLKKSLWKMLAERLTEEAPRISAKACLRETNRKWSLKAA
jgi:DNA-binding transcriptional regulator YiaG